MPPSSPPVRRAPVRLILAVAALALLLAALASRGERTAGDAAPPPPSTPPPTSTTAVYAGPTAPSLNTVLELAGERYGAAIRATVAFSPPPAPHPSPRARANPSPVATVDASGDRFDRLASCESGDGHGSVNPGAVSPGGRYRGAFQFTLASWQGAGESGDPVDHDYATQKAAAIRWAGMTNPAGQWPKCWPRTA